MDTRARRSLLALVMLLSALCLISHRAGAHSSQVTYLYLKLSPHVTPGDVGSLSARGIERWAPFGVPGWIRVAIAEEGADKLRSEVLSDPAVLAVESEHRLWAALTPDDPYWLLQWGAQRIDAPTAWNLTVGSPDVVVAVLDSGVDVDHPDLVGQLWANPGEIAGNSIDDDRNGKIDDIHGWCFNHGTGDVIDESSNIEDEYGHGTHVSGIAAAAGNNGQGVAGIAWGSRLMIVRVLDASGRGWYSDVAAGIVYAVDNGARIINLSLGGPEDDLLLRDAVEYAYTRDVLIVAAAGNGFYDDYGVLYPAAYDAAIAVAASDINDQWSSFSRYGPQVDLAAPGASVYSTGVGGGYRYMTGTSMAAPHVSALAALIWSWQPTLTMARVMQLMVDTAADIGAGGWDPYTGWGRIDAGRALSSLPVGRLYLPIVAR